MPIVLADDTVPADAIVVPFQRQPGTDPDTIEVAAIAAGDAGAAADQLHAVAHQIAWKAPRGRHFPNGHLVVDGADVSRQNRPSLTETLGSIVAVCSEPSPAALAAAWHTFLERYRDEARSLAAAAAERRQQALEQAAAGRAAYENEMRRWIAERGSLRLVLALQSGERVYRLYREERRDQELPGLLIDADASIPTLPLRETPAHAAASRNAVQGWIWDAMGHLDAPVPTIDLVYVDGEHIYGDTYRDADGLPAVRVSGWLGRHTLFGFCATEDQWRPPHAVDGNYPDSVQIQTQSPLRPTAYASAYGLRHPAAQEALKLAAVVMIDMFGDMEHEHELAGLLPRDAHDFIDDELVRDLTDTLFLVGWKLGQPQRLSIACLAEAIAAKLLLDDADGNLEMMRDRGAVTDDGFQEARRDLQFLEESLLGDELYEYFEMPDAYDLEDVAGAVVEPRRMMLWAPFHHAAGDPPPRITASHEPSWDDPETAGMSASESVQASAARRDHERAATRETLSARMRAARWRADTDRRDVTVLLAEEAAGCCLVVTPPVALAGDAGVERGWTVEQWPTLGAFRTGDDEDAKRLPISSWEDVLGALPAQAHPLAVDAVIDMIARTMSWHDAVSGHALPGGPVEPFEQAARSLAGTFALRRALEEARASGLIRDKRLTRFGVRHEHFGDRDAARFEAIVRLRRPRDVTPDQALADFHERIYDFSPLPVALTMDVDPDDPSNVRVHCAMAVHTIDEAWPLSQEIISQLRWRTGFEPADLEDDEDEDEDEGDSDEGDGIRYEIREINRKDS